MEDVRKSKVSPLVFLLLAGVLFFLGYSYLQPSNASVQLTFLDVGQGDATLAVTPKGQDILIDGGPNDSVVNKLDESIPFYNHKLDAVVLTHPHADHVAGLVAVANKYQINKVYMSGVTHTAPEYLAFLEILKGKNVDVQLVKAGDSLDFGDGIKLDFLFPLTKMENQTVDNLNNSSVVTKLSWGDSSAIFMGDLESEGQDELLASNQNVKANIIKISHHGSKDSVNASFLVAVGPKYAVIPVGKDNKFGHPAREMLELLKGLIVYRTDYDGDVKFELTNTAVMVK
jgi:competence protein ComEC